MASLVADYGTSASDSSDENSEQEDEKEVNKLEETTQQKLPLPSFGSESLTVKNSVFANPFIEAETAKVSILEKHVKMIPAKDDVTNINGKKICWMYRKGRCRFGHNCKYAHDSDVHSNESNKDEVLSDEPLTTSAVDSGVIVNNDSISKTEIGVKKKKRPGLSQTLVPGKTVLKMYKKQKVVASTINT